MKKIVFVDDEKDIIELYQLILEDTEDLKFYFYSNPMLALEFLKEYQVDLVVCDEAMQEINGLEVLKSIRHSKLNNNTRFYLASGNPDLDSSPYQKLNCLRFFQKPFEVTDILDMIKKDLF